MNNDNPAEMSNQDLEKDMEKFNAESSPSGNQEMVQTTTAAEGTLKTPLEDASSAVQQHTAYKASEEQDLDDLVHQKATEVDSQDGSLPDPEFIPKWEDEDDDNKISG